MKNIDATRLDPALAALGEQLAASGAASVHLVVIGGSGLIAIEVVDRATSDVDVIALVRDDELVTAEPLPPAVVTAAALVARDLDLPANWLNAGPQDVADLRALAPTADELRSAARWARTRDMPGPSDDELTRVLAAFGVEDEGRLDA